MSTASKPLGKAMYVAPRPDWDWLQSEQRKLYTRSEKQVDYVFCKLWGLVTDPRNLRTALARVAGNRGRRTAGVDGITVGGVVKRVDAFVAELRSEIRSGAYRPLPVRRVLIPKLGAPGKFRPLGIPTVKDRVVQAALKNILEPIFEADFFPVSYEVPLDDLEERCLLGLPPRIGVRALGFRACGCLHGEACRPAPTTVAWPALPNSEKVRRRGSNNPPCLLGACGTRGHRCTLTSSQMAMAATTRGILETQS